MGQGGLKVLHLWRQKTQNPLPKKNFFRVQTEDLLRLLSVWTALYRFRHQSYAHAKPRAIRLFRSENPQILLDIKVLSTCFATPEGDSISGPFTPEYLAATLNYLKPGKCLELDSIFLEFILQIRPAFKSWLYNFLSSCIYQLKILRIWRRTLIVVIPKPEKPFGPKSYCLISVLCVPFKILKRLIYGYFEPIIGPLLPQEQAGFQHMRLTIDQATLLGGKT